MAVLTYTFADLKNIAQHATGKSTFGSGTTSGQIVNRALEYVVQSAQWSWRIVKTTLAVASGTGQIDLPSDFGEIVAISGAASPYLLKRFRPVGQRDLDYLRAMSALISADTVNLTTKTIVGYAVTAKAPGAVTSSPIRQLELAPTPSTNTSACINLTYAKLLPTLSGDTDVPAMPTGYQDLLFQVVRGFAYVTEEPGKPESAPSWAQIDRQMEMMKAADKRLMPADLSELGNVIEDYYDAGRYRPTWT